MRNRIRAGILLGSIGLAIAGMASPAVAEGSWSSYFTGVKAGFETRSWHDNQNDDTATKSTISGCKVYDSDGDAKSGSIGMNLYREVVGPDKSQGARETTCSSASDSDTWTPSGDDDYHITFKNIYQGDRASAGTHKVAY